MPTSSVPSSTVHQVIRAEGAGADERGDLALLHEPLEALPQLIDDLLLAGLGLGEVDRWRDPATIPNSLAPVHGAVDRRRLQELLGRDAAPVQAGAADLGLLDHGDVETRQAAAQGGGVAGGTAADDDDIELLGRGDHLLENGSNVGRRHSGAAR